MSEGKSIYAALQAVQRDLKAPKAQNNSFGKYKYRSAEDILEAVKPLLNDNGLILTLDDDVVVVGDRFYIKVTATVIDSVTGDSIITHALAREPLVKKGMDDSQITGTASSYARKYALNGLFAIDDTKDADTDEYTAQTSQNRAGAAKPQNTGTSKGSANDELVRKAMHSLTEKMKQIGCTGAEVSALAGVKMGKTSTKDMSVGEISTLANNLESWIQEQMAG